MKSPLATSLCKQTPITALSETEIEFSYPNETLINKLPLQQVAKIIFKSGREQVFTVQEKKEPQTTTETQPETAEQKTATALPVKINTIAVMPIPYVNTETLASSAEMAKFAQNDMYSKLIYKTANIFPLVVQDLRETNSLLKKAGIDYSNID